MKCFPEQRIILIVVLYLHGKATIENSMINGLTLICSYALRVLERFFYIPIGQNYSFSLLVDFSGRELKQHSVIQLQTNQPHARVNQINEDADFLIVDNPIKVYFKIWNHAEFCNGQITPIQSYCIQALKRYFPCWIFRKA